MIRLRMHHLMCMHLYSGTGYSLAFCRNLERILATLQANPATAVTLVSTCDDICRACPNRSGRQCKEESSILLRDRRVAGFFQVQSGLSISYRQLLQRIEPKLSSLQDVSSVCIRCAFRPLCDAVLPRNFP